MRYKRPTVVVNELSKE